MSAPALMLPAHDIEALEFDALPWADKAQALAVIDQGTCDAAGEMLVGIKGLRAKIGDTLDPIIAAAHAAHKVACEQKRTLDAPLLKAETTLKLSIGQWMAAAERARQEAQARLREQARLADEERRLAEAVELEAMGEPELAAETLTLPSPVPTITLPKPTSADGVTLVTRWTASVTDIRALCRGVVEGVVPVECVMANMPVLNRMATALRQSLSYPGVRAVAEQSVSARAR